MNLTWCEASDSDIPLLANWNHQLIHDEDHSNPMSVPQLSARMEKWLSEDYTAVIFSVLDPVGYALFKKGETLVYLRQLFVRQDRRREGIGCAIFEILRQDIWPSGVRMTVEVLCKNEDAVSFWRSMGFRDYSLTLEITP